MTGVPGIRLGLATGGTLALPLPTPGSVRFRAANDWTLGVVCELNGPVLPPTGAGTHDLVERKGRVALTEYHGKAPMMLKVPVLLDRWSDRKSIEPELRMLERLHAINTQQRPPRMIVEGRGVPYAHHRAPSARWVFDGDPDWDGDDIRTIGSAGVRAYIAGTVTLLRVSAPAAADPEDTSDDAKAKARHVATVDAHDRARTLKQIAAKHKVSWRQLHKLNPKLPADPDKKLPGGTRVRIS